MERRRSVEFSSAAARCIPWRVDGRQQRGNLSKQKKSQGMWIFPNLKPGAFMRKKLTGRPVAYKTAMEKTVASSKSDHPGKSKS